jgi:cytochrome c oxidase assembly factor CtaG
MHLLWIHIQLSKNLKNKMNRLFAFVTGCVFLIFGGLYGVYEMITYKGNDGSSKKS